MKYKIDKQILLVRTIGNVLIFGTVIAIIFTFWPITTAFGKRAVDNILGNKFEASQVANPDTTFGSLLGKEEENVKLLIPKDPNFSLIVEKIGADAPIIANVDPSDKDVYNEALRRGVAHALGTSFPGQAGVTYLFAHSTDTIFNVPRFNAIFYLLNDLNAGDDIVVFFNSKRYNYKVVEKKITEPEDVSYFNLKTEEQILVMQTCYPPGTTWKRLLVIAKPLSELSALPLPN